MWYLVRLTKPHLHSTLVHLLGEDAISRVHEDNSAVLLNLAQLLAQSKALLPLPEVAEVLSLVHDRKATGEHLKLEGILGSPGDDLTLTSVLGHAVPSGAREERELWRLQQAFRAGDCSCELLVHFVP
eukprot:CAMPEP_0171092104 /NCGR_PEP_ID=MMETSP0766_2-20121228/35501_1 /TAXON_ID=439317 /ORGANISM="Gambierdiscus australes, Strain CAWD 149" /LENGTH=127 /DNA_ID=CAMNT_0011550305 /DNA_START=242 /DNA_END=625 /DNA_ORIENTATION=+